MKTVQMTLEEELVRLVDEEVKRQGTNRSAFVRQALRRELKRARELELESRQRAGYGKSPVAVGEFDGWEEEQSWGKQ